MKRIPTIKLKDRRVSAGVTESGSVQVQFRIINKEDKTPRVISELLKGKLHVTTFNMSKEAASALFCLLGRALGYFVGEEEMKNYGDDGIGLTDDQLWGCLDGEINK